MALSNSIRKVTEGIDGEQTPLLRENARGEEQDDQSEETLIGRERGLTSEDEDSPNQNVGTLRGVLIALSLWGLIFLQAANMSGITTTQSKIAEDLDAFGATSWFTSSYLVYTLMHERNS